MRKPATLPALCLGGVESGAAAPMLAAAALHRSCGPIVAWSSLFNRAGQGLALLDKDALKEFVDAALQKHEHRATVRPVSWRWNPGPAERASPPSGQRGIAQVQDRLRRYLHARTGLALTLRPLSALPAPIP